MVVARETPRLDMPIPVRGRASYTRDISDAGT